MAEDHGSSIIYDRPAVQWFTFLAGPLTWFAQILASYFLISVVCGAVSNTVIGILLHLASAVPFVLTAAAGLLAIRVLRYRQRHISISSDDPGDRSAFMGGASILISLLFLMVISFSWIGVFLVSPCT